MIKIPPRLQIHPELARHSEELRQSYRSTRRDSTPLIDDLIYPLERDVDCVSEFALSKPQRLKKLLKQHFSGMGWRAMCRNSHVDLSDNRRSLPARTVGRPN